MSWKNLSVVHVVAMDNQRCIGANNGLPWNLPGDLQHFKRLTQYGVIIMGRKTYDSIGRSLPSRKNLVLTNQTSWSADGVEIALSLDEILDKAANAAKERGQDTFYIIGGAKLFASTLDIADRLEITHIDMTANGDTFYPQIPAQFTASKPDPQFDANMQLHYQFVSYIKTT